MTKNQEELELRKIIVDNMRYKTDEGEDRLHPIHLHEVNNLASAILSAGYVKLSEVELDEEKINYDDSLMLQQVIFEHSLSDEQKAKKIEKMFSNRRWSKPTPSPERVRR